MTGRYTFGAINPIVRSSDAQPHTLTFDSNYRPRPGQDPLAFAQSVYDVMQGFRLLREPSYLGRSALLLNYVIGGNIGTFVLQGKALPLSRLTDLRDELKSVLRGVADFSKTPEFGPGGEEQWYPAPSVPTPGAMINGDPADFGVYNLNPYVWFIHIRLGMSGYGFSLDDDTANAQDAANSLQVAYGGTAATAPGTAGQKLANQQLYTYGAPFGKLEDQGYIDTTSGFAMGYDLTKFTVISGLSVETVGKLNPFDAKSGQGALVTGYAMKAGTSRVFLISQANPVNGANASHVVLNQPTPEDLLEPTPHDGPTGPYTFSGFSTTLPVINFLAPTSGAVGSSVKLTGSGFTKARGVTFDGFPASTFTVNSDASITVTVPAGATSGRIGVRGPAGTGYSTSDFTVVTNRPPVPGTQDPAVAFVNGLNRVVLNRDPDAPGRAGGVRSPSEAEAANDLLTLKEYPRPYPSASDYLVRLYADVPGQAPDAYGTDAWLRAARGGLSQAALADAFLWSPEADLARVDRDYAN
jgi:hypothetical protein